MTSISSESTPEILARQVLQACIEGRAPERLPQALLEEGAEPALFGILAEGLADRFEPVLCLAYARLFSQAIPGADFDRYLRVRVPRPVAGDPDRVFVLSRVTLGADIAVTSVLLDAAKRRFPNTEIVFAGPRKNFDLFAADPRLTHAPLNYRRAARMEAWIDLDALVFPGDLVLDPDSRITQLGLLPLSMESGYHLFESRSYGAETDHPLPRLASDWCVETLGVPGVPYLRPGSATRDLPTQPVSVSLGVGENPGKRIPDPFESQLLQLLGPAVVDCGASPEESARVQRAARGAAATLFQGPFADFTRIIARSGLYVGYDSAGQHAAAALGVPLISIFAGFPVPRMFHRWRPSAPGATVIRVDHPEPATILELVRRAL